MKTSFKNVYWGFFISMTNPTLLVQLHWPLIFSSGRIHHVSLFWNGFLRHFDSSYVSTLSVFSTLIHYVPGALSQMAKGAKEVFVYGEVVLDGCIQASVADCTDSRTAGVSQGAAICWAANHVDALLPPPASPRPGGRWSGQARLWG